MTGQEKGDLSIQVTAWAGLTIHQNQIMFDLPTVSMNSYTLHFPYQRFSQPIKLTATI
jgi:hypothetical protein